MVLSRAIANNIYTICGTPSLERRYPASRNGGFTAQEYSNGEDVDSDKLMDIIGDLPESYADYITPKEIEYLNDNRYMLKVREYLDSH